MISVTPVEHHHVTSLLELLQAKAQFDGARDTVRATEASLRHELFRENPFAKAIVAETEGRVVGMATFHATFSSFLVRPGLWLDDLFVLEDHRGKGVGRALIRWLACHALQQGAARIDWIVARDNDNGRAFYSALGATIFETVRLARLDEAALRAVTENVSG